MRRLPGTTVQSFCFLPFKYMWETFDHLSVCETIRLICELLPFAQISTRIIEELNHHLIDLPSCLAIR